MTKKTREATISKRFGQARLAQDGVGGVPARYADRHREIPFVIGLRQIS